MQQLRKETCGIGNFLIRTVSRGMLSRKGQLLVAGTFIGVVIVLANFLTSNQLLTRASIPTDLLDRVQFYNLHMALRQTAHDPREVKHQERIAVFSRIFQKQAARRRKDSAQTCIHPKLDLKHDANKFAYHDMPPISCTGHSLFFARNGAIVLNSTVVDPQTLGACYYYSIDRVSDGLFSYSKLDEKQAPPFDVTLNADFIRIRCILKTTLAERERIALEEEKEINAAYGIGPENEENSNQEDTRMKRDEPENLADLNMSASKQHMRRIAEAAYPYAYDARTMGEEGGEEFDYDAWERENQLALDLIDPESDECDFDQFLVQIYPRADVFNRTARTKHSSPNHMRLNVLMVGMDSMSRLSFQRKLPKTYRYLKEELDAAILHSYNIVGDATTAALIPIFTGKTEMELPEVRISKLEAGMVDEYPMVWKLFQRQGYATLYAEDEPALGTFNLRLNGFDYQPTDHYMRHFWVALWESSLRYNSQRYCTGNVPHHRFTLKYVEDFFLLYRNVSRFAFGFHSELTHANNNPGEYMDADLTDFIHRMQKEGVLEDTVLIVMGDHGARYSEVRNTVQGKLEERLPMMSFVFPEKFKKTYPHLWHNLKINTNRLSTPFDIHETFLDILDLSRTAKSNEISRGLSLLREIPANRTCSQAGIAIHWCGCLHQVAVDTSEKFVKPAALELVSYINMLTMPYSEQCAKLQLKAVHSAHLVVPNERVLKYSRSKDSDQREANFSKAVDPDVVHYQLQIETEPCGGLFEATVMADFRSEDYQYSVTPGISRINMYGDQPKCIESQHLNMRKFCCCRSFLNRTIT